MSIFDYETAQLTKDAMKIAATQMNRIAFFMIEVIGFFFCCHGSFSQIYDPARWKTHPFATFISLSTTTNIPVRFHPQLSHATKI